MQQSPETCDVILVVGEKEFPAHREVLNSASEYFTKLFDKKFIEGSQKHVTINNCAADTMSVVLDYIYSGSLKINNENAVEILRMLDYFGMDSAKNMCSEHLIANMNEDNWVQIYLLGEIYRCPELVNHAKKEIANNLDQVSQTEEFQKLSDKNIEDIITKSIERYKSNIDIAYKGIIRWVKHDVSNRKILLGKLLRMLPAYEITLEFFVTDIQYESLLRDDVECNNWVIEGLYDKCHSIVGNSDWLDSSVFVTSRLGADFRTYKCNIQSLKVHELALRPDLSFYTSTHYRDNIYMTGGVSGETAIPNKVSYRYNRIENTWSETDFKCGKTYAGSAVLNDQWYVIGGIDMSSNHESKTYDVYDFNSGKAFTVPSMKFVKRQPGVVTYNGSLFACCGFNGRLNNRMVERFDPREGCWKEVYSYSALDGGCTAAVINDYLYCMRYLESFVEKLDFRCYKSEVMPYEAICDDGQWMATVCSKLVVGHSKGIMVDSGNDWKQIASLFLLEPVVISRY